MSRGVLSYTERDGMNNQLIALRSACILANISNRTLMLSELLHHHREGMVRNTYRLKTCDVIDCTSLFCPTTFVATRAIRHCTTLDCILQASSANVYLPNKVAFRLDVSRRLRKFCFPQLRVHPRLDAEAMRFVQTHYPFDVAHLRQFGARDYELGERPGHVPSITWALQRLLAHNTSTLFVMTQECRVLQKNAFLRCLNDFFPKDHGDLTCLLGQLAAVHARRFDGDSRSTVSQFVMRRRFPQDRGIFCNRNWCWFNDAHVV